MEEKFLVNGESQQVYDKVQINNRCHFIIVGYLVDVGDLLCTCSNQSAL